MTMLPGYSGACTVVKVDGEANLGTNQHVVKSLVLVNKDTLIIDGTYHMPLSSGAVEGYSF